MQTNPDPPRQGRTAVLTPDTPRQGRTAVATLETSEERLPTAPTLEKDFSSLLNDFCIAQGLNSTNDWQKRTEHKVFFQHVFTFNNRHKKDKQGLSKHDMIQQVFQLVGSLFLLFFFIL